VKNKIDDLRNHLFATLEALQDPDKPMEVDRARAVADVAKVLVESAKVEIDMLKATGALAGTGFIPLEAGQSTPSRPALASGSTRVQLHVCPDCKRQTKSDPCEHCDAPWARRIA
jgi:hypothetical protein